MNIYLIRHGETKAGVGLDEPQELSRRGVIQARRLGKRLSRFQIDKVFSSDAASACRTTDILRAHLTADIVYRHDLREIDLGAFRRGWEYINEFYPDFAGKISEHREDVAYPGGESGIDVLLRASNVITEILETGCENVAVVTHAGTIGALLCGVLGLGQARRFLIGSPIEFCSISMLTYDSASGRFYAHTINDHAHLETMKAAAIK